MGKRSRTKQREPAVQSQTGATPAPKPRLRERIAKAGDSAERAVGARPSAPWDPFPLSELAIFVGLVFLIGGAFAHGGAAKTLLTVGVVLACLGGLETAIREHFAGYRSHAMLLASVVALVALGVSTAVLHLDLGVRLAITIAVGALLFFPLRRTYTAKSGGKLF